MQTIVRSSFLFSEKKSKKITASGICSQHSFRSPLLLALPFLPGWRRCFFSLSILASLFLFFAPLASAQTPTVVTGTITDPNGLPYSNARVSAQLIPTTASPTIIVNGIPTAIGGQNNATADVNGSFSMNLFCNSAGGGCSVISPSGTQWQFTVTTNGIAPPLGTGSQSFSVSITITGTSQNISTTLNALAPALSRAGQATLVTSNPPTCSVGQIFFNTTSGQLLLCVATNTITTASGASATLSDVMLQGARFDTKMVYDATFAVGTGNITTTANDPVFVASDAGSTKIMFGTNASGNGGPARLGTTVVVPQGSITTFNSAHSIVVSTNSTANCTAACTFIWGHDDTAPIQAAASAAVTAGCIPVLFGAGAALIQASINAGVPANTCGVGVQSNRSGQVFVGWGVGATYIIPTPNYNTANGVFTAFSYLANFTIYGGDNNAAAGTFTIAGGGINSVVENFNIIGWGANSSLTGLSLAGTVSNMINSQVDGGGSTACAFGAGDYIFLTNVYCGDVTVTALSIGGRVQSSGGSYTGVGGGAPVVLVSPGGVWMSEGERLTNGGAGGGNSIVRVGGTAFLSKMTVTQAGSATNINGLRVVSGGKLTVRDSSSTGTTNVTGFVIDSGGIGIAENTTFSGTVASVGNSGTYFDQGGNTYSTATSGITPTCAMTTGGGTGPACTLIAGSTNEKGTVRMTPGTTPGSTGTTTITFQGTFAGATNTTPSCVFDVANTGSGTWNIAADAQLQSRSTTTPVFTWNNTLALTAASTYDVEYICIPR